MPFIRTFVYLTAVLVATSVAGAGFSDSKTRDQIASKIQKAIPKLPISSIQDSVLEGFYEVELANGERIFVTADGGHFIAGDLFSVADSQLVNLTEMGRNERRREKLAAMDEKNKIIYTPKNKKVSVTVFTDVDCGYCRRLHNDMAEYLDLGIEIKYLAFPRAGIGSASHKKIATVWCSADRNDAMTRVKAGESLKPKTCENPVAEHYALGNQLGVSGTPALVLESGQLVPGYIPPARLAQMLGI